MTEISDLLLGVNIDHIATIRNSRNTRYPDPVYAAFIAETAGADSITVHLREDRRHITDQDVFLLRRTICTKMNLEMAATKEMVEIAQSVLPDFCCLVPENREEMTTEGGLDVISNSNHLSQIVSTLQQHNIRVSIFVDPDISQIEEAAKVGVSCIEIHTGYYANVTSESSKTTELIRINQSAQYAKKIGLQVHAGHGINYHNVKPIAEILSISELNIGHAIISRAFIDGLKKAIRDMKYIICESRR